MREKVREKGGGRERVRMRVRERERNSFEFMFQLTKCLTIGIAALSSTPGPGAYAPECHYYPPSTTAPEFSMGKRLKGRKDDKAFNPAPNRYSLPSRIGDPHPDLRKAPAYYITFRDKRGEWSHEKNRKI